MYLCLYGGTCKLNSSVGILTKLWAGTRDAASYSEGSWGTLKLTGPFHLVPRLRIHGPIAPLLHMPSWSVPKLSTGTPLSKVQVASGT